MTDRYYWYAVNYTFCALFEYVHFDFSTCRSSTTLLTLKNQNDVIYKSWKLLADNIIMHDCILLMNKLLRKHTTIPTVLN